MRVLISKKYIYYTRYKHCINEYHWAPIFKTTWVHFVDFLWSKGFYKKFSSMLELGCLPALLVLQNLILFKVWMLKCGLENINYYCSPPKKSSLEILDFLLINLELNLLRLLCSQHIMVFCTLYNTYIFCNILLMYS